MGAYSSYKIGADEFTYPALNPVFIIREYEVSDLDTSNVFKVPIEAGTVVLGVGHEVVTGFVDADGDKGLWVGDSVAANNYCDTGNFTLTTTGNFFFSQGVPIAYGMTGANLKGGKKYNAANYIRFTHSTGLESGKGRVYIEVLLPDENWRTSGQLWK